MENRWCFHRQLGASVRVSGKTGENRELALFNAGHLHCQTSCQALVCGHQKSFFKSTDAHEGGSGDLMLLLVRPLGG